MSAPHMSPDEFRALGRRMVDWIADYMERVESFPVLADVEPGDVLASLPDAPPDSPGGADEWEAIFTDLERIILPGMTHWQSPGFFGYFPCNASGPAILGELLSAGLGVQGMLWQSGPACTELEMRMLDWMAEAIGLPRSFSFRGDGEARGGGSIQGTASEATLVAMVAARRRARPAERIAVYASDQAHSSVIKAAMIRRARRGARGPLVRPADPDRRRASFGRRRAPRRDRTRRRRRD